MNDENPQPAHWSKDFVEHLRTVHFTLIAACVGLLVLASFPSKTEVQTAHEQASEILQVVNRWNPDLFTEESRKIIEKNIIANPSEYIVTHGPNFDHSDFLLRPVRGPDVPVSFRHPSWFITDEKSQQPSRGDSEGFNEAAPRTLQQFQRLWDGTLELHNLLVPTVPKQCFHEDYEGSPKFTRCKVLRGTPLRPSDFTENFALDRLYKEDFPPKEIPKEHLTDYKFEMEHGNDPQSITDNWFLLVEVERFPFDEQQVLTGLLPEWKGKYARKFNDAFRELSSLDEPMLDSTIKAAERILDAQAKRTGDAFQAAGLTIPADVAIRCGVILIFGIELYMWVHLREFGSRVDRSAGFEVAWIGVYFSKPARIILGITLFLLPICTVLSLGIRGLRLSESRWIGWTILVTSTLASIVTSYLIFRVLPQPEISSPLGEDAGTPDSASVPD